MSSSRSDSTMSLTGYSRWAFLCALFSEFGITGYYSNYIRGYVPDWFGVGLLIAPVFIILFIQWGELPDRVVVVCHIVAATWFMVLALGMEIGSFRGYRPDGDGFYRILAHLGWTFSWAGIYRRAKKKRQDGERDTDD